MKIKPGLLLHKKSERDKSDNFFRCSFPRNLLDEFSSWCHGFLFVKVKWKKMMNISNWKRDHAWTVLLFVICFSSWSCLLTNACPFLCQCVNDQYIYCDGRGITPFMLQRMTKEIPANARFIDLSQNKLDNIPIKVFDHFTKIHHLNLAANQIRDLNPRVFYNLTTLNKLNLQANLLSQIRTNLLSRLTELEELHLECNYIQY